MKQWIKSTLLWIFAFILTLSAAVYQRITGPSYPLRGEVIIGDSIVKYKLLRTWDGTEGATMTIETGDGSFQAEYMYKRFKSFDDWTKSPAETENGLVRIRLPHLEPAGKMMYQITLIKDDQRYDLSEEPVILRYKGKVPDQILIPHIIIIFLAMLFSTRTGLEALFRGPMIRTYTWLTFVFLLIGGMILGPMVQKYAFGVYWSGWPFGHDLTDNKSLVAFILWIIALIMVIRKKDNRTWPIIAAIMMLTIFLIPHSVLGSEIDYTKH
ncbi:MAG: hypothetical protein FJY10_05325 [Bacteroidetes bacterium]|nr:hypothetical protein [Bacteroidota bacterium]